MEKKFIDLAEFDSDPFAEFMKWHGLAVNSGNPDVNAMTLSTVSAQGKPAGRIVLFKGIKSGAFTFYTNYESAKGKSLEHNPYCSLVFYWPEIYRQVRVEGKAQKMTRFESEAYFKTRPRESQLGAWTSHQSQAIESLESLERRFEELGAEYEGKEIPCPPYWGGYLVLPERFEFWVGGTRRLHERVCYSADQVGWKITLLSP